jgi:hypothetical protein
MKRNNETGSLHAVIIAVLFVALMATLGVVFYQNFVAKKADVTPKETKTTVKTSTDETARVAFNSNIYALDHPSNWKATQTSQNGSTLLVENPQKTVRVKFVVSEGGIGGTCDQNATAKITSYTIKNNVNTRLTGESLSLVEALYDHDVGGYDYHIGLTEDGGATHASVGEAFCNVAFVGVASTPKFAEDGKTLQRPLIVAEVSFPKLGTMKEKPAAKDMQTIKDLMATSDYKAAVKILESARKE